MQTRSHGSLVAMEPGEAFAYSIFKLSDRGSFFIGPGTEVYVGMIVGAPAKVIRTLDEATAAKLALSARDRPSRRWTVSARR